MPQCVSVSAHFCTISHIVRYVQRLINLLKTYLPQARTPDTPSSNFDSLIVIDRRVDMITPLLTQLTYEGLIDELLGIKNCECRSLLHATSPINGI